MPKALLRTPISLEDQCLRVYYNYLYDEMHLLFYLGFYEEKSLLLKKYCLPVESLLRTLERELNRLKGLLRDIVLQKMIDIVIANSLHQSCFEPPTREPRNGRVSYRDLPAFRLLELFFNKDTRVLDFSINKEWSVNDQIDDMAICLWNLVAEKCPNLEKLVIPNELCYNFFLDSVIRKGSHLKYLSLKRNVPSNLCLNSIGQSCPNLCELDIANADVVTDFGVICLLFEDPGNIFNECWDPEKTAGPNHNRQNIFPNPHVDKSIPDPTENCPSSPLLKPNSFQRNHASSPLEYLYLKRTFYEVTKIPVFAAKSLPICKSLKKLRLENTRVKGDGASVIIECCPNVYSLGYLVFASAGLKQVFGIDKRFTTKFTEIFYRGPSDQKLQTIGNCCPKLNTMFLGSNSVRRLHADVFRNCKCLEYLTLENIIVDDVTASFKILGKRLKGLKIQCKGIDLAEIALYCPNLVFFIIQNENPLLNLGKLNKPFSCGKFYFSRLKELEVSCPSFPKNCLSFIIKNTQILKSIKVFEISNLTKSDFEHWRSSLAHLETLILYRARGLNRESVDFIIESLPSLSTFGNLKSCDLTNSDISRVVARIEAENWDLKIVKSDIYHGTDEKEFSKLLSLHWFYLTPNKRK